MSNFLNSLYENARKSRLDNRAMGYDYVKCSKCNGTGEKSKGCRDYDSYGPIWRSGESCSCLFGQVKVYISKSERIEALKELIAELEREENEG